MSRDSLEGVLSRSHEKRTPCGEGDIVWREWGPAEESRPPLVLLHGGSGAWNHWIRTIPSLEARYRLLVPDLPGCGDSADPPRPYDAASLAGLLSRGLDHVLPDDVAFDLVSFSFGGVLSGLLAQAQARRIRSLTLVGVPVLGLTGTGPANDLVTVSPDLTEPEANSLHRRNLQKLMFCDPQAADDLAVTIHRGNLAKARLRSRGIARTSVLADSLRDLPCRLGCIFGAQDATLRPDLAGVCSFVEEIKPGTPIHVVPDAGHWVQYEAAGAVNALLSDLVEEDRR